MNFEEANKAVHPVENQWHYPIMIKYGYDAKTKEDIGFVRNYLYVHPVTGKKMRLTTGSSADYWTDLDTKETGFHGTLKAHLESVK